MRAFAIIEKSTGRVLRNAETGALAVFRSKKEARAALELVTRAGCEVVSIAMLTERRLRQSFTRAETEAFLGMEESATEIDSASNKSTQ